MINLTLDIFAINLNEINLFPKTTAEEIVQNIKIILTTIVGSVPLDRKFGIDNTIIDIPINISKAKILINIFETIHQYEPRVEVVEVNFDNNSLNLSDGKLCPNVKVRIKNEYIK